ncbi:unnamed protein product [Auanema sp. JU1783]|nr:unnamed protein product [Auanema sp. JU1783]
MNSQRKQSVVTPTHASSASNRNRTYTRMHEMDYNQMYSAMEKGHKVCRLNLLKKWDPAYKMLVLRQDMRMLHLFKLEQNSLKGRAVSLDIRHIREVQTLEYKLNTVKITDKWKRDKEIQNFESNKILVISYGTEFTLNNWILLFETLEACRLWNSGLSNLVTDTRDRDSSSHHIRIERFLAKSFDSLTPLNGAVARKHMKPFVQTTLQFKVLSKQLQEVTEDTMTVAQFSKAARSLVHIPTLFSSRFNDLSDDGLNVSFYNFLRFLEKKQYDDMAQNIQRVCEFLRRYLHHFPCTEKVEPSLTVYEFCDFLFSRENSVWDPLNEKVIQDMNRPLSHYWIASSHNTYLTGDQLRSDSSLDCYAQALLMGCRCIELDCWDGQRKPNSNEFQDIVIYHGYTITSKLLLRDVLYIIKHYAFITSEYPVILSIEDNCSVPAQRLLALEIKEILGDYLLVAPVNRDETQLPSPAALKKKIILKHKKLPIESEDVVVKQDEFEDTDILARDCEKRGVLYLKDNTSHEWKPHVFVLFNDRLCYLYDTCSENFSEDSLSQVGDEEQDEANSGFELKPDEMHVSEEWFHGRCDRNEAAERLLQHKDKGNGLFMIRDSNLFIGDYSLSFLHKGKVHHVRIKTTMSDREKKYYFLENKMCDTLYELVSYYTRHYLTTADFVIGLTTPCPQPQPHLNQPWFSATANKDKAEELLSRVNEDGAFLIRMSTADPSVFVLSLRVDGEFWHYRLKREGRIFVVNQSVFENLNQIVQYYGKKEFVRGICLRYPVNEKNIDPYSSEVIGQSTPGCYMELGELNKEIQARSLRPYHGISDDDLSFPANATITVLRKEEGNWRGRYGSASGWFPSSYVQEILPEKSAVQGETNYYTIELGGTVIERLQDGTKSHAIKISQSAQWSGQQWSIAASSNEEVDEWYSQLIYLTRSVNDKLTAIQKKEKSARIAAELSNLVVYCQAVPFDPASVKDGCFYEMCSFVEGKLNKLIEMGMVEFNFKQLSRVYPHGSRITSTNYNPIPMWNAGCHMVALNYQTGDKAMQLNQGKFLANGQCGYILKPDYLLNENFDPSQGQKVTTSEPIRITLQIIAGRHLSRKDKNKGICSPFVEVEIIGAACDDRAHKTRTIASNGLNPVWNETFTFEIHCPELALLRFYVEDGDFVGPKTDPFIGQAVFPVDSLRCGFRSVPLKNQFSEDLELSALLLDLQMITLKEQKLLRNTRTLLQGSRFGPVLHRKLVGSDSVQSPVSKRDETRSFRSFEGGSSTEGTSPVSISGMSLADRKTSTNYSMDSQDSNEGTAILNGSGSIGKKKKNFIKRLIPFKSKEKD